MFSKICTWINNRVAGDLRRHLANYDVTVMWWSDDIIQHGRHVLGLRTGLCNARVHVILPLAHHHLVRLTPYRQRCFEKFNPFFVVCLFCNVASPLGGWCDVVCSNHTPNKEKKLSNEYTIMYVGLLEWQTVNAPPGRLFWCLFPELRSNEGNKQQNNTRVSA